MGISNSNESMFNAAAKAIKSGRDNPQLLQEIKSMFSSSHMGVSNKNQLAITVLKTVFKCLSSKTLKQHHVDNYEAFLLGAGRWLDMPFKQFSGVELYDVKWFDPKEGNAFPLMMRCLKLFLKDFDASTSTNNSNLTMLQSLCRSRFYEHQAEMVKKLVEIEKVDIHVTHAKHGKALHLLAPNAPVESFRSVFNTLVDAGADPEEAIEFTPVMNMLDGVCPNYLDCLEKIKQKFDTAVHLKDERATVNENVLFVRQSISAKRALEAIDISYKPRVSKCRI